MQQGRRGRRRRSAAVASAAVLVTLVGACGGASTPTATPSPSQGTPTAVRVTPTAATTAPTPTPTGPPTGPPTLALQSLGSFASPVWAGPAPGDTEHLYLVLKSGTILQLDDQGRRLGTLLDLRGKVSTGGEQGLLSMAFDPAYARNGRIYVNYTDTEGDTQVVAYTVVDGKAVRPQTLLSVAQPYSNHNGGLVLFDPSGMLLVGMGDGGNAGDPQDRAQDLDSLLGKILRIDPRTGAAAKGNPYARSPKVWALGLRNPWRFSFDTNGDLYVGDVGQNEVEELDVVPPDLQSGANYGWPVYEGNIRFKDDAEFTPGGPIIAPALTYSHAGGGCSITVGEVYRGRAIPSLVGRLLYGDYCAGDLMTVQRTKRGVTAPIALGLKADALASFGHDADGEVLVLTVDTLYRLVPGG